MKTLYRTRPKSAQPVEKFMQVACVTLEMMVGTPNGGNFRFPMCLNPSKADH